MIMNIADYTDHDTTEGLELARKCQELYEREWKMLGFCPDLMDKALLAEYECEAWAARVSEDWGVKVTHMSDPDHTYEIDTEGMLNCDLDHLTPTALAGIKARIEIPRFYDKWPKPNSVERRQDEEILEAYGDPISVELDSSTQPPTMHFSDKTTGEQLLTIYPSDGWIPAHEYKYDR